MFELIERKQRAQSVKSVEDREERRELLCSSTDGGQVKRQRLYNIIYMEIFALDNFIEGGTLTVGVSSGTFSIERRSTLHG